MKHLVSKLFEMECEKQRSQVESEKVLIRGTWINLTLAI